MLDRSIRYRRHSHVSELPTVIVFFLLTLLFGTPLFFVFARSQNIISPLPSESRGSSSPLTFFFPKKEIPKKPEDLKSTIVALADSKWKNYSILVVDLKGDFQMGINDTSIYDAASVNKLPILAALYYEVQKGSIKLNDSVTLQRKDIQDYGTGSIRYDAPGTTYSIQTLARLMIKQSDNTAAYILANYTVGLDTIQTLLESWGLSQTDMVENTTSNRDMAMLLAKMYQQKVTNKALTLEMMGFMKDTDFEKRLPGALPEGVTVYHKIGNGIGNIHDVGIVEFEDQAYSIGILTEDIRDEPEAEQLSAEISRLVYEFMKNEK